MRKADVIIQARVGSTRLPNKVLLNILDKPILEYVIERAKKASSINTIVVATTEKVEDKSVLDLALNSGVNAFSGSEDDVLDRFYKASLSYKINDIVRITADCPLIDPALIDNIVEYYLKKGTDYCSNTIERTFPDGEDVEVFSFQALEKTWKNAKLVSEREHVTPYIRKSINGFKLINFKNKVDLSMMRWTLDEAEDFEFIKKVLESIYPSKPDFSIEDIVEFIRSNPEVEDLNKHIVANKGYHKLLSEDKFIE